MRICGLLGENISYSKSPDIHTKYYKNKNVLLEYKIFDIKNDELPCFINNLRNNNIIGFNVTIPYKENIIKYLDKIMYPADKIFAVNTVLVKNDILVGYNTDYFGFIKSLQDFNLNLSESSALIIGAGGAAKAVYHALVNLNCKEIIVSSRNAEKANLYFGDYCKVISLNNFVDLSKYKMIINCTPLGGINYREKLPIEVDTIKEDTIVYDLVYNPTKTNFLKEAENKGAIIINGESMLEYQAYKAADIWIDYIYSN